MQNKSTAHFSELFLYFKAPVALSSYLELSVLFRLNSLQFKSLLSYAEVQVTWQENCSCSFRAKRDDAEGVWENSGEWEKWRWQKNLQSACPRNLGFLTKRCWHGLLTHCWTLLTRCCNRVLAERNCFNFLFGWNREVDPQSIPMVSTHDFQAHANSLQNSP